MELGEDFVPIACCKLAEVYAQKSRIATLFSQILLNIARSASRAETSSDGVTRKLSCKNAGWLPILIATALFARIPHPIEPGLSLPRTSKYNTGWSSAPAGVV